MKPRLEDRLQRVPIASRAEWRDWLFHHHLQEESIWVVSAKRGYPGYVSYDDLVEEALCFGWIDSRPAKLDEERSMLLFSPRKKGSVWSKLNKERVERLASLGLIHESGMAKIMRAQQDGSWDALNALDTLTFPEAFTSQLSPDGQAIWATITPGRKRALLQWFLSAKTEETLTKRIQQTLEMLPKKALPNERPAKNQGDPLDIPTQPVID